MSTGHSSPFVNQHTGTYQERGFFSVTGAHLHPPLSDDHRTSFTFIGKERDEETGYGYFSFSPLDFTSFVLPSGTLSKVHRTFFTRYMDADLLTSWLSVDPMADKYPSISPYAYCVWNPVKLVDPDGRDWYRSDESGSVLWKDCNDDKVSVNGEQFRNIGTSYQRYFDGNLIVYGNSPEGTISKETPDPNLNLEGGQYIPSQFTTDDGTKVSVSFGSGANNSIAPNTVSQLIKSVNNANNNGAEISSITISCTTDHASNKSKSAHTLTNGARALDISKVNDISVSTSNIRARTLQEGIKNTSGWMENYGPFIIQRSYPEKVSEAPWARTCCSDGHYRHIHLSTPK